MRSAGDAWLEVMAGDRGRDPDGRDGQEGDADGMRRIDSLGWIRGGSRR